MQAQPEHKAGPGLIKRMIGAARLQASVFEDVEADRSATLQAAVVVVVVAISTGIGLMGLSSGATGVGGLLYGVVSALIGWAVWAWIIYMVGAKLLPDSQTHSNWGELARALAFAQSPGIFKVVGVIPGIGVYLFLVVQLWQIVATVIGVRQALDYSSSFKAFAVVCLAFIPYVTFMTLLAVLTTGGKT